MDQLEAMRIFARVAELASFTRAAESLGIPKASASTTVAALETELGARLLHRTTRRVELTQDGRVFYDRCKDLLADVDELHSLFEQTPAALSGRLRVDMPASMARDYIVPALPEFLRGHPKLTIELSSTDRLVDLVREGFDCVLRVGNLADSALIARPLGSYTIASCASPDYLQRQGKPRRIEDLQAQGHQLIHYSTHFGARPFGYEYWDGERYRTLQLGGALTVNSAEAYEAACLSGLGIIQAPLSGRLREHIKAGRLQEILPKQRAEPMPVNLLYVHRRHLPKRVQVFMNWVAQVLQPHLRKT